jgi:hypothetical protein
MAVIRGITEFRHNSQRQQRTAIAMTECNQSSFGFEGSGRREIVARFDGRTISSNGGAFLLRQTDRRINLLARLGECFLDGRNQALVEHSVPEMVSQRVYGLALGYEDLNDHEQLRTDPVFGILAGKEDLAEPLAGKSTLNRMELGTGINSRYKKITFWKEAVDELLVTPLRSADPFTRTALPERVKQTPAAPVPVVAESSYWPRKPASAIPGLCSRLVAQAETVALARAPRAEAGRREREQQSGTPVRSFALRSVNQRRNCNWESETFGWAGCYGGDPGNGNGQDARSRFRAIWSIYASKCLC